MRPFFLLSLGASLWAAPLARAQEGAPPVANPHPFGDAVPPPEPTPPRPVVQLPPAPRPSPSPVQAAPTPVPTPTAPPLVDVWARSSPHPFVAGGRTMVPLSFFSDNLGASAGAVGRGHYKLLWFGQTLDCWAGQRAARRGGEPITLAARPLVRDGELFVPLGEFCGLLGLDFAPTGKPYVVHLKVRAARVVGVRSTVSGDRVRTVVTLSNPTPITASVARAGANFQFAGARAAGIPETARVGDDLVPQTTLVSGNWNARFAVKMNYAAPISWFTLGFPTRLVIDSQRLFEETSISHDAGLTLTRIRRGTGHGPVQMWAVRLDPREGWRVRVEPGGYSVLQRARTSRLAARQRAVLAVNGGFFAYDGAAVGAMLVGGEWIRLPWGGRTAVGFDDAGRAHIAPLQTRASARFSSGLELPVRDLNGWPAPGRVSVLTRRFAPYYKLGMGEMAVEVMNGVVVARPGGGGIAIPAEGFVLVASGAARPYLEKAALGERASLSIAPIGWPRISTALGGGPLLLQNGQVAIRSEGFRSDVTNGIGPRTAFGVDRRGRYLILIADGRQKNYSTGLTLPELAATMQKLGAVQAMNLDGGGSTTMAVKGRIVNKPSDGTERSVSNALLVMR